MNTNPNREETDNFFDGAVKLYNKLSPLVGLIGVLLVYIYTKDGAQTQVLLKEIRDELIESRKQQTAINGTLIEYNGRFLRLDDKIETLRKIADSNQGRISELEKNVVRNDNRGN